MDYYEDRKDSYTDLGSVAFNLLMKLLTLDITIVVSDFLQRELETFYTIDMIRGMTLHFERIIKRVQSTQKQRDEAKLIARELNIPKGDVLHAIVSRDNSAILISRDNHFQLLKHICKAMKPEEVKI